jgi:hypothetical protein
MNVLPVVKSFTRTSETFELSSSSSVEYVNSELKNPTLITYLLTSVYQYTGLTLSIRNHVSGCNQILLISNGQNNEDESYTLLISPQKAEIHGASDCGLYRGITTFLQMVKTEGLIMKCCQINDSPDFKIRGLLHDTTRGKVPTLDTLKEIALQCAFYKINQLQLNIEHSFAFSMIPEFSVFSDPLTPGEILELDEFCRQHYIELVPALATFGHLYELLRIKRFAHLNELDIDASTLPHNLWDRMAHYTLDPGNKESLELVKRMIGELLPLFSSKYFNICADETFDLGLGKSKEAAAKSGVGSVYAQFVNKILEYVIARGKTPMMWGDIILNHPEILSSFPQKTVFLNWGYGPDVTSDSTEKFARAGVSYCVCPGVTGWSRFASNINDATINIQKMVSFGNKHGAIGVLNTNWGDCGNVNFFSGAIHGIAFGAALSWNAGMQLENESFDTMFSQIQWGEKYLLTGRLLRELGSCTWYHFGNIYGWVMNLTSMWNKEVDIEKIEMGKLIDSYLKAGVIQQKFLQMQDESISGCVKDDLDEFVWSATAVHWTCALLIYKKVVTYGQVSSEKIPKSDLISQAFSLIGDFKVLWRKKNKESEMIEVVRIFYDVIKLVEKM